MFFANFPVSCCRAQPPAFSYAATAFSQCHLSLACAIFLQDLDLCLAYKASSGYLLSFVLNICNEKKQEVKELIELKNRPRQMSRNLCIQVITCRKYIRGNIFVLLMLISSFSSLLAYNAFVLVFCNFFIGNHKLSLFRRRVLCIQYFESAFIHATHLLFYFSSSCATNQKSYLLLAPNVKCLGRSIANDFLKLDKRKYHKIPKISPSMNKPLQI